MPPKARLKPVLVRKAIPKAKLTHLPCLAIDSETTGPDFIHGCVPFFVSTCTDTGLIRSWEWDVDPFTRKVQLPPVDHQQLCKLLYDHRNGWDIVFHNAKFDIRSLASVQIPFTNWANVHDTILASHVIASKETHKLKELAMYLLDIPEEDQSALKDTVNSLRDKAKKLGWMVADEGNPNFPGNSKPDTGWWVFDMWLPRAWAKAHNLPPEHPYWTVLSDYANRDSERTVALHLYYREALKATGLLKQYELRRRLVQPIYDMETRGITLDRPALKSTQVQFNQTLLQLEQTCVDLSDECITVKVDKHGKKTVGCNSPKQVSETLYKRFELPILAYTDKGNPSTDKDTLKNLSDELNAQGRRNSKAYRFIEALGSYRKYNTACNAIDSYELFSVPAELTRSGLSPRFLRLHPSFNITGTDTTRFSSSWPNAQNISKQEDFNMRAMFGPLPGRIWYSGDFSNIELRIFGYESQDEQLIAAFKAGRSAHLIICALVYPDEFQACLDAGEDFDVKHKKLYGFCKNGTFSLIYGAGEKRADNTYGVKGAYRRIRSGLPQIDSFMQAKFNEAQEYGYITTLGGYRLQVPTTEPHKAVNYFVQGSAGECMAQAIIRVYDLLQRVNDPHSIEHLSGGYHMIMTIHDELVFDFPRRFQGDKDLNLPLIRKIKSLMELSGQDINIPIPVGFDRIDSSWAKETKLQLAA